MIPKLSKNISMISDITFIDLPNDSIFIIMDDFGNFLTYSKSMEDKFIINKDIIQKIKFNSPHISEASTINSDTQNSKNSENKSQNQSSLLSNLKKKKFHINLKTKELTDFQISLLKMKPK